MGTRTNIKEYVASCDACQRNKYSTLSLAGFLQPFQVPHKSWVDISIDSTGGLPKHQGKYSILVVVNHLTKYAIALSHPFS